MKNTYFNRIFFSITALFLTHVLIAQNFNNTYMETDWRQTRRSKGKSLYLGNDCRIYTVNSIRGFSSHDFQLAVYNNDGTFVQANRYGLTNGDEFCHSLCRSLYSDDEFLIAGESINNHMLVMKVDIYGNVFWSKEIVFASGFSEVLQIIPVDNAENGPGYIAVGNIVTTVNDPVHMAVAKFDDTGNLLWKYEYSSALPIEATDAEILYSTNQRVITITGNYNTNNEKNIFALDILTTNGDIHQTPTAYYSTYNIQDPQVVEVETDQNLGINELIISFKKADGSPTIPFAEIGVAKINAHFLDNITWKYSYETQQPFTVENNDLSRAINHSYSILGEINEIPFLMELDQYGNFITTQLYNEVSTLPSSVIQGCDPDDAIINGEESTENGFRLIKQNSGVNPQNCTSFIDWQQQDLALIPFGISIIKDNGGVVSNYGNSSNGLFITEVIHCSEPIEYPYNPENNEPENTFNGELQWFYPNPANNLIQLNLKETSQLITIYSITGELVVSSNFKQYDIIDISELNRGVYFIHTIDSNNQTETKKLIIN